jgi:signal transduction histidine kinase
MMPDMDGMEICQKIRANPKWEAIPVIAVTALSGKEDLARCFAAGADDFISKPVNGIELRARVASMLRIKQQRDRLQGLLEFFQQNLQYLRSCIAYSLPHEFNTPMNGILGSVDLLIDGYKDIDTEERQELLQLMKESAERMNGLIQNFLTYARLELTKTDLEQLETVRNKHYETSTRSAIADIAKHEANKANRWEDLVCEVEKATLSVAAFDLQKITEELVSNALKFSPSGTPVQVIGQSMDGMFQISVIDGGTGMTSEQIQSIGAYVQFDRASNEQQGMGLGLAIAKAIAEIYGKDFQIHSEPAGKTTVQVVFSLANS